MLMFMDESIEKLKKAGIKYYDCKFCKKIYKVKNGVYYCDIC